MYSWYYHRQRPSEGHLGREKRRAFSSDPTDCPLFSGTSSITDGLGKSKSSPSSSSGFVFTLDGGTPSLDWSHRCLQSLANLHHTGPNCLVRSSLHLVFGRPCFLVESLGGHSVALIVQRLSHIQAMWLAHLCFAFLIALMISLTPVSWRIQVFHFRSRRVMPSMMHSILRLATASLSIIVLFNAHVSQPYVITCK